MSKNKLPNKYVLIVNYAVDEEPEELITKKEFPFLSWAMKELSMLFEKDLKEFKDRNGYFPDTEERIYDEHILLFYETSPYCHMYYSVKPIKNEAGRIVYRDQVIAEKNGKCFYYLYDQDGEIVEFEAKDVKEAKKIIDARFASGCVFNADGEVMNDN